MDIEGGHAVKLEQDTTLIFKLNRPKLLNEYYKNVFPFDRICRWLAYSDWAGNKEYNDYFNRREISYNMASEIDDNEFVIRHLCYANPQRFKADVVDKNPLRIDIGAVFDQEPRKNKDAINREKSYPLDREFVIDIDMSDYDSIRSCCTGKKLCQKCWKFMWLAYEVLKRTLAEDFGFKEILWVFSGRRGIHAWICDERARMMRNEVRSAATDYLDITDSNDKSDRLVKPQVRNSIKYYDTEKKGQEFGFEYPFFR